MKNENYNWIWELILVSMLAVIALVVIPKIYEEEPPKIENEKPTCKHLWDPGNSPETIYQDSEKEVLEWFEVCEWCGKHRSEIQEIYFE